MIEIFDHIRRPIFRKICGFLMAVAACFLLFSSPVSAISEEYEAVLPQFGLDYRRLDEAGRITVLNQHVTLESAESNTPITLSIDWGYADENCFSFGYRIDGLPHPLSASRINGEVTIHDKNGISFAHMGSSEAVWNSGNSEGIIGFWHTNVQPEISKLGEPPFTLSISLNGLKTPMPDGPIPFAFFFNDSLTVTDTSDTLPEETVGPFVFELDLPVYPLEKHTLDLVSEAGGMSLRLVQAETTPAETILSFCYVKPDAGDWMLSGWGGRGANIKVGSEIFPFTQYQLLRDPEFDLDGTELPFAAAADERCVALRFGLGKLESPQHYEIRIDEMMLSLPEAIPDDQIEIANQRLAEEGIAVVFETYILEGGGGGGGWKFTQKPDGMTDEVATRKMLEAMEYFHKGPWQFSFDLP